MTAQTQDGAGPDGRRALLDIIAELDQLAEPGPTADYIRMLAEYGLGEAAHPDEGRHPDGCHCQFCREDEREERERADREELDDDA